MKLLTALVSGIGLDAANGTARIFKRGGNIRATYYLDFEGTVVSSDGADVRLDSYGRSTVGGATRGVYVSEYVQVNVYSAQGVMVSSFVDGESAGDVEVRSLAFTGTDYMTGQNGVAKPITLAAVLDKVLASFGTTDWKVLTSTGAINLQQFASFVGLFINVKDPTYGAVGDGVADDAVAINAAIDAANATGGIVFFPPGTYRITASLTPGTRCLIWGAGAGAAVIVMDHATNGLLTYASASAGVQELRGLTLAFSQANASHLLRTANTTLSVQGCIFGDGAYGTGSIIALFNASFVTFTDCTIRPASASSSPPVSKANAGGAFAGQLTLRSCRVVAAAGAAAAIMIENQNSGILVMDGCTLDGTLATLSNFIWVSATVFAPNVNQTRITNSVFVDPAAAIVQTCISVVGDGDAGGVFESGNLFGLDVAKTVPYSYAFSAMPLQLGTRELSARIVDVDTSPVTLPTDQVGTIVLYRDAAGAQTLVMPRAAPGSTLRLSLQNDGTGGAITFTWPPNVETGAATTDVANDMIETWQFVCMPAAAATALHWKAVGIGVEDTET